MKPLCCSYILRAGFFASLFCLCFCLLPITQAFAFGEGGTYPSRVQSPTQGNLPTSETPSVLQGVSIQEKLGGQLDRTLTLTDENGRSTTVSDMLAFGQPLILTLNYFRCSTLCSLQLAHLAQAVKAMDWPAGKNFRMATISFDSTDTPELARSEQARYVALSGQTPESWKFYVAKEDQIQKLTEELGFYYKFDPKSREFAHAAAIFFISPDGRVSRYLYGIDYKPRDIKFALIDASENKIGTTTEKFLLTCFHYNPTAGRYDAFAVGMLRSAAVVTLVLVFLVLGYFFWRDRRKVKV